MLSCEKCRNGLSAYLDKKLTGSKLATVERHLSECETCRAVLNDMRKLETFLHRMDVPPVPPALASRILTVAHERKKINEKSPLGLQRFAPSLQFWKSISPAAAALLLGLGIGTFMGLTGSQSSDVNTAPAVSTDTGAIEEHLYAISVFSPVPHGSIEAATLALMEVGE